MTPVEKSIRRILNNKLRKDFVKSLCKAYLFVFPLIVAAQLAFWYLIALCIATIVYGNDSVMVDSVMSKIEKSAVWVAVGSFIGLSFSFCKHWIRKIRTHIAVLKDPEFMKEAVATHESFQISI